MGAAFRAALADPDLTCLRSEIALQTVMIEDRLEQLFKEEGPAWSSLVLAADMLQLARAKGEPVDADINQLDHLIRSGAACARTRTQLWGEVRALMVEKTRTAAAEAKRLADLQGVVRVEDALTWARALLSAAREVVTDQDQLRRLQERALVLLPPDEYDTGPRHAPMPGAGTGNGHAGPAPAADNGQAHDAGPATDTSSPGDGESKTPPASSFPRPAGAQPAPAAPPAASAPPAPGPACGLRELPPGADPDEYEWIPDDGEAAH
jgi:hypothetical protein